MEVFNVLRHSNALVSFKRNDASFSAVKTKDFFVSVSNYHVTEFLPTPDQNFVRR